MIMLKLRNRSPTDHALLHIAHHGKSCSWLARAITLLLGGMITSKPLHHGCCSAHDIGHAVLQLTDQYAGAPDYVESSAVLRTELPIASSFSSLRSLPLVSVRIILLMTFRSNFVLRVLHWY